MKRSLAVALFGASMLATPAFAQLTLIPMPPAPQPGVVAPAVLPSAPVTPLTADDTLFVRNQLEANAAEIQVAQVALQRSQNQNIRNFAQKMITDHTAANGTLMVIATRQGIAAPTTDPEHQAMIDSLSKLSGLAFDTAYITEMMQAHDVAIKQMNDQLVKGQSQQINAWVQNTRPAVLQHAEIAQQIKDNLPRSG